MKNWKQPMKLWWLKIVDVEFVDIKVSSKESTKDGSIYDYKSEDTTQAKECPGNQRVKLPARLF